MPHLSTVLVRSWHLSRLLARAIAGVALAAFASAPSVAANLSPAPLAGLTSSHTYTPTVGEALGRIVAKTLPNSPLNAEVLAQAFVSLNPKAFSGDAGKRTLSAATLKVPNHNQLVQLVLAKNEAARPAVLAALDAPEPKSATAPAARAMDKSNKPDKRENWVRYAGTSIKAALNFDGSADERNTWVHYLGAAVQRVMGGSTARAETQQWVHHPRVAVAVLSSAANALPGAPEAGADTRNWVRYSASRSYLAQPSAPLLD